MKSMKWIGYYFFFSSLSACSFLYRIAESDFIQTSHWLVGVEGSLLNCWKKTNIIDRPFLFYIAYMYDVSHLTFIIFPYPKYFNLTVNHKNPTKLVLF
jgi:hypothetical protein